MKRFTIAMIVLFSTSVFVVEKCKAEVLYEITIGVMNTTAPPGYPYDLFNPPMFPIYNDETIIPLDRSSFPQLEVGKRYRITYEYRWRDDISTCSGEFDAVFTCNLDDPEAQDWMGYVDYGTLFDQIEFAGFSNICADAVIGDGIGFEDWEPGEVDVYLATLAFHFSFSLGDPIGAIHITISDIND